MKYTSFLIPIIVLLGLSEQMYSQPSDSLFISTTKVFQTDFIARFTGETPIDKSGTRLGPRSTPRQRAAGAEFLYQTFEELEMHPKYHSYRALNVNFFVDLLIAPFRGKNVYATIPATIDTDEHVILGAHYDSEAGAPGAIDNATGVALNLMIGKELLKVEKRTKHVTIVFFDQEEDDEIGSKAFSKMIKEKEWNVHSVHISDLIGWDSNGDRAVEIALAVPEMEALYTQKADMLSIPIQNTRVRSSDHKPFYDLGYDALLYSEAYIGRDSTPYLHSEKDTFETVNFDYLASATQLMFEVIKELIKE